MKYVTIRTVIFTFLLVSILVLSGCTISEKRTNNLQADELRVFKFGVVGPLTGPGAMFGEHIRSGVDLAVEEINTKGGVLTAAGKRLVLKPVYEDSQCDGAKAATAVRKLIDVDNIQFMIVSCSPEVLAAAPILEEAKVVGFSTIATSPKVAETGDYIFRNAPSDKLQGKVGAKMLLDKDYKRVAIFYVNHAYGAGLNEVVSKAVKSGGSLVVASEMYEPGATDFKTILIKFKDTNPDVIYIAAFPQEGAIFVKQMKELGITVPIVASEGVKDPVFLEGAGNAFEGLDITLTVPSGEGKKFPQFKEAFMKKYGKEPGLYASESYDAVYMLARALEKSDGTGTGIKDALYKLGIFVGAAGTTEFDELGEISKPYDLFTIKDGNFVRVSSAEA
ncbi:MAG TPA: ABC transporter substrate-binding protein [Patescibacteria group bacterium]|nr:ABC transporter substrate-binding protein [Patescibacteria group bacterium]